MTDLPPRGWNQPTIVDDDSDDPCEICGEIDGRHERGCPEGYDPSPDDLRDWRGDLELHDDMEGGLT